MPLQTEERAPDPSKLREIVFLFDSGPGSFTPTVRLSADSEGRVHLDTEEALKLGRMFLMSAHDGWDLRMLTERGTR